MGDPLSLQYPGGSPTLQHLTDPLSVGSRPKVNQTYQHFTSPAALQTPPSAVTTGNAAMHSQVAEDQQHLEQTVATTPAPTGNALSRALKFAKENPAKALLKVGLETLKLPFRVLGVGVGLTLAVTGAVVAAGVATIVGGMTGLMIGTFPLWGLCLNMSGECGKIVSGGITVASWLGTQISDLSGACIGLSVSDKEFGDKVAGVLHNVDDAAAVAGGAGSFVLGLFAGVGVDVLGILTLVAFSR